MIHIARAFAQELNRPEQKELQEIIVALAHSVGTAHEIVEELIARDKYQPAPAG